MINLILFINKYMLIFLKASLSLIYLKFTIGFEVQAVEPNKYVICSTDDHIVEQNYTFMEKEFVD